MRTVLVNVLLLLATGQHDGNSYVPFATSFSLLVDTSYSSLRYTGTVYIEWPGRERHRDKVFVQWILAAANSRFHLY